MGSVRYVPSVALALADGTGCAALAVAGLCRQTSGLSELRRSSPLDDIGFGVVVGLVHVHDCPAAALRFVQEQLDREPPPVADDFRCAGAVDARLGDAFNLCDELLERPSEEASDRVVVVAAFLHHYASVAHKLAREEAVDFEPPHAFLDKVARVVAASSCTLRRYPWRA